MLLLVSFSGEFGGAERLLVQFAQGLAGGVCVACPAGGLADAARAAGFPVLQLPRRRLQLRGEPAAALGRLIAHGRELRRLAGDLEPELVIAWGMRSALACGLGAPLPCPFVFQHNDLLPGAHIATLVRRAARRAAATICLSHAIAQDLGVPAQVIHPGAEVIDTGEPPQPPVVLVLGALTEWKRPDLALEAVALARRARPELRLRLVGAPLRDDGEALLEALRARAAERDLAGAVELAGPAPDSREALSRCTALLHCAPREPFGMAVLEALAAGRPAVVPDAAGPAEIVDSTCGRRYRPGDAGAAARALLEVLDAPGLGAGGPARVREHFDLEASRRRYGAALAPLRRRAGRAGRAAELTVVTVTRNSARELRGLLASAARELPGARVVVVDCDSSDESVAVAETFASARVIALAENAGFARACNLGVAAVDAGAVALVNPDVELVDGSLGWLAAEALREDPGAPERLLAPLVLLGDGSRQDSVHPRPVSSADLLRSLVPPALLPPPLREHCEPWRARAPRRVGWAVGCALVARADTLRRLGPFEERLFLYGEDLELGVRAARAGVETWFWPGARVIHHRAHSSAREFGGEPFEALAQARHDAVRLALGPRRARVDDGAQALTFRSRAALKRALGRDAERERRQLEALHRVR